VDECLLEMFYQLLEYLMIYYFCKHGDELYLDLLGCTFEGDSILFLLVLIF